MDYQQLIEDLQLDLNEYARLYAQSEEPNNQKRLTKEMQQIQTEILNAKTRNDTTPAASQRFPIKLTSFSFHQSSKYVKVLIALDGVRAGVEDDAVVSTYTERSMSLRVSGLNGNDYELDINYLLHDIMPAESYHTIKTNVIVMHGRKTVMAVEWPELTVVTKQLKDIEQANLDFNAKAAAGLDGDDPRSKHLLFMKAMQQVYQTGSPKVRRVIAQACANSEDRIQRGEYEDEE